MTSNISSSRQGSASANFLPPTESKESKVASVEVDALLATQGGDIENGGDAGAGNSPEESAKGWLHGSCCNYIGKPIASALAGAVAVSPLAIAVGVAMADPKASAAILGTGAATGLAANVAKLTGHPNLSEGIMKALGALNLGLNTAVASAPWAARFPSLEDAAGLATEFGWEPEQAMMMVALMRVAMTVAYTIAVPDAVAAVNVVTSALQEGCARLADAGGTPLMVPELQHTGKFVHCAFSVGATSTLLTGLGATLQPGHQSASSTSYETLVKELSKSPMAVSSGVGFLVWASAMRCHLQEGGSWKDMSKAIKDTSDKVEKALTANNEKAASVVISATEALNKAKQEYAYASGMHKGTDAVEAAAKAVQKAEAALEKARRDAEAAKADLTSTCAKLKGTLEESMNALKKNYVATVAGAMTQGVTSPWHFEAKSGAVQDDGTATPPSKVSQASALLGNGLTSPITAMAVYSMCEQQLLENASLDHQPGGQAALLVLAYVSFTSYWLGVLFNWVDLKTPNAIAELNATPRTSSTEAQRAILMIVGAFGATYTADKLFDEAFLGRHAMGDVNPDEAVARLVSAGTIALGCTVFAHFVGRNRVDSTRASEATAMAFAAGAAGALDGGVYGALSAAAGVSVGELGALIDRFKNRTEQDQAAFEEAQAALTTFRKEGDAKKLAASIKSVEDQLAKLTPEETAKQVDALLNKLSAGGKRLKDAPHVVPRDLSMWMPTGQSSDPTSGSTSSGAPESDSKSASNSSSSNGQSMSSSGPNGAASSTVAITSTLTDTTPFPSNSEGGTPVVTASDQGAVSATPTEGEAMVVMHTDAGNTGNSK